MNNIIIFIFYFLFSCAGMTLIKLGGQSQMKVLFTLPIFNMPFTILSLIGFACYGLSFVLYAVLLNRYELSFLNPTTVGITSVLIFIFAAIIFGETITFSKIIGLFLILSGVFIINLIK